MEHYHYKAVEDFKIHHIPPIHLLRFSQFYNVELFGTQEIKSRPVVSSKAIPPIQTCVEEQRGKLNRFIRTHTHTVKGFQRWQAATLTVNKIPIVNGRTCR